MTAYVIAEITPTDADGYLKVSAPILAKVIIDGGGKFVARGGKTLSIEGAPPAPRVVVFQFDSLEKASALLDSEAFRSACAEGKKYTSFRIYAVEGIAS